MSHSNIDLPFAPPPNLLVGVQLRRIGRQGEELELAVLSRDKLFDQLGLVDRVTIDNQEHRLLGPDHQALVKLAKYLGVDRAIAQHETKLAARTHCRDHAQRETTPRHFLPRQIQRLLRGEAQEFHDPAHQRQREFLAKPPPDQCADQRQRPQAEGELTLSGVRSFTALVSQRNTLHTLTTYAAATLATSWPSRIALTTCRRIAGNAPSMLASVCRSLAFHNRVVSYL